MTGYDWTMLIAKTFAVLGIIALTVGVYNLAEGRRRAGWWSASLGVCCAAWCAMLWTAAEMLR